jgi:geranylgeranyl pyrophosphate synthase
VYQPAPSTVNAGRLWYKEPVSTINPKTAPGSIREWLASARQEVDEELGRVLQLPDLPENDPVYRLGEAMAYAVLGAGKRLRPALTLAACEACGGTRKQALPAAAAIEILHAYTLVHDDLPAMDDDEERRGRPTVHIKYDEATAILVGDALLTLAFGSLARLSQGAGEAVALLARRSGRDELLGGQMLDLAWQAAEHTPSLAELERLHAGKTGALFSAACELGAIAAGASSETRVKMAGYGLDVGVAFQHADDLDDGDFAEQAAQASKRRLELTGRAARELEALGSKGSLLRDFATWIGSAS